MQSSFHDTESEYFGSVRSTPHAKSAAGTQSPLSDLYKVRAYGNSGALTVEEAVTEKGRLATAQFEFAPKRGKSYDFSHSKQVFQLSPQELPLVIGLFLGYLPRLVLIRDDGQVEMERQRLSETGFGSIRMHVKSKGGNNYSLPVQPGEAARISAMLMWRISLQCPCPPALLLPSIKGACSLLL